MIAFVELLDSVRVKSLGLCHMETLRFVCLQYIERGEKYFSFMKKANKIPTLSIEL
jgi:hypothetical protein